MRATTYLIIVVGLSLFLGCEFPGPPEPFVNDTHDVPEYQGLGLSEFAGSNAIAGDLAIQPNLDSVAIPFDNFRLAVDGRFFYTSSTPPYTITLQTDDFDDGPHLLTLGVVEEDPNLGVLNLSAFPSLLDTITLQFDQSPPTPLAQVTTTLENNYLRLDWPANTDPNFHAYIIERQTDFYDIYPTILDTITNQHVTSYVDSTFVVSCGVSSHYEVFVSNRAEMVSDDLISYTPSRELPITVSSFNGIKSPIRDEIYVLTWEVSALSTIDHSVTHSVSLAQERAMALSLDGSTIYVATSNETYVLNASDFEIVDQWALETEMVNYEYLVAGERNRLYYTGIGNALVIMNSETGETIMSTESFFWGPTQWVGSLSGDILYITHETSGRIRRLDLSTDSLDLMAETYLDENVGYIQIDPQAERLFASIDDTNYLLVIDAVTLAVTDTVRVFDGWPDSRIETFYPSESALYVSALRDFREFRGDKLPVIYEINAETFEIGRTWYTAEPANGLITTQDDRHLYFIEFDSWTSDSYRECYLDLR